eukprot:15444150-Alexandrium_andersonii.AAC.1
MEVARAQLPVASSEQLHYGVLLKLLEANISIWAWQEAVELSRTGINGCEWPGTVTNGCDRSRTFANDHKWART